MKNNPRTLNTDYDKWLKKFQYETLKNLYKRWDAVMAGAETVSYTHLTLPTTPYV